MNTSQHQQSRQSQQPSDVQMTRSYLRQSGGRINTVFESRGSKTETFGDPKLSFVYRIREQEPQFTWYGDPVRDNTIYIPGYRVYTDLRFS